MAVLEAFVYDPLIVTILEGKDRTEGTNVLSEKKQTITNNTYRNTVEDRLFFFFEDRFLCVDLVCYNLVKLTC